MGRQLMCVDLNNFVLRCIGWKQMQERQNLFVDEITVLFDKMVHSLKGKCKNDVFFVWCDDKKDEEEKYWRNYIHEDYKANRGKSRSQDFVELKPVIVEHIKKTMSESAIIKIKGIEADDIAYAVLSTYKNQKNRACTTDADWLQLISEGLVNGVIVKQQVVTDYTDIDLLRKIMSGDKSDNIKRPITDEDVELAEQIMMMSKIPEKILEEIRNNDEFIRIKHAANYDDPAYDDKPVANPFSWND